MFKEAHYYARMARHYGRFIAMPPIPDPESAVRNTLACREQNFLNLARRGIFENTRSPYYHLLRLASCTVEDLEDSVRRKGLETTLKDLREAGVYLSHEEVKGKPVLRNGKTIPNDVAATANPGSSEGIESISSGSRSGGTATPTSNEYRLYRECYETLARQAFGSETCAFGVLRPILPSPGALVAAVG